MQNEHAKRESNTDVGGRLKRLVMRYRKKVAIDADRYDGKEHEYTFHGGFERGYNVGKLSALEDIADLSDINIDA